jgi:hypothetical protein
MATGSRWRVRAADLFRHRVGHLGMLLTLLGGAGPFARLRQLLEA